MERPILIGLGGLALMNGLFMWALPGTWYQMVPGVDQTGPFNLHFIRDIALVFGFSGGAMVLGAVRSNGTLALAGATWPGLHALFHIQIWTLRGFVFDEIALVNLAGIQAPAWLALAAAWQLQRKGDRA